MSDDLIERILAGSFPDPDGGPPLTVATRSVVIARSLAAWKRISCARSGSVGGSPS